jgi:hypothetical protein
MKVLQCFAIKGDDGMDTVYLDRAAAEKDLRPDQEIRPVEITDFRDEPRPARQDA